MGNPYYSYDNLYDNPSKKSPYRAFGESVESRDYTGVITSPINPNNALLKEELPQNYHKFASSFILSKMGPI